MPPTILVTEPAEGQVTREAAIAVAGSVSDATPATLTVNGLSVPLSGGSFATSVSLPGEGDTAIGFEARDAAGNVGAHVVHVVVDRTPPQLTIASPAEGAVLTSNSVSVSGTVADATAVTVTVDGATADVTGQGWQADVTLGDGPHTLSVVATDAAGNQTTATRSVTVETTPLAIAITSPSAGLLTRAAEVEVAGTLTGSGATVTVSMACRRRSRAAASRRSWPSVKATTRW
jgi:hypothetical protein